MPSFRQTEAMAQQIKAMLGLPEYHTQQSVFEAALRHLHGWHFPSPHAPHVMGHTALLLAEDGVCSELDIAIPSKTRAYREDWSDGRPGAILSREAMLADGYVLGEEK